MESGAKASDKNDDGMCAVLRPGRPAVGGRAHVSVDGVRQR